jgi:hypothetical protein
MNRQYIHPRPLLDLLTQGTAVLFLATAIALFIIQLVLAVRGVSPLLVCAISTTLLLLVVPALWLLFATPPVWVDDEGITLRPRFWSARRVPWAEVRAAKPYPLLPERDAERVRQALVGRANFRAAEGFMLIIPTLPAQYRFQGVFAQEGFTGVIALTSRTHTDYDVLRAALRQQLAEVWVD